MYNVYIINDNLKILIHANDMISESKGIKIINGTINEGINSIDAFSFDVLFNHPSFNDFYSYKTRVEVLNANNSKAVFKGRVVKHSLSMDAEGKICKSVECEGRLGYLHDTLTDYLPEQYWNICNTTYNDDGSIAKRGVIDYLLDLHNRKQLDESKHIYIGEVTVTDDENVLYFGMQQSLKVYDAFKEKLLDNLGGEISIREGENNKLYLDYKPEVGELKNTSIALRKNLKQLLKESDPTKFITRLYPLGQKIKKEVTDSDGTVSEVETNERMTCSDANNGIPYVDDEKGIEAYGIIEGYRIFDHVTKPSTLLNYAKVYLSTNNKIKQKYSITALDLSKIGLDIESFEVGNYYPIENDLLNISDNLRIIKKTINISNPEISQLEIGDKYATLSDLQLKRENEIKKDFSDDLATVENNAQYNVAKMSNNLTSLINQFSDRIVQMIKEETISVSEFETYKNNISTEFTQTKNSFDYLFKSVKEEIKETNGIVATNQNEIIKYIRFEDGNIILGMVGNEVLLRESNDRISFLQNNIEVAYFSNNKLFITYAEFTNGIKIFDIELLKEPNGSYSLV